MMNFYIRWMIRRDMPEVLAIEGAAFEFPWTEEEFIRCRRQRNCIGMVCEYSDEVIGYMLYELHKNRIHLLNFAVAPSMRRCGAGRNMVTKLASKLSHDRRNRISLEVRETNLEAQLFFREMGFRGEAVLHDFYEDTTEDAYFMQYYMEIEDGDGEPDNFKFQKTGRTHGVFSSFSKFFHRGRMAS